MASERPYPRFRRDLIVRRIVESGDASWTVHDPLRNSYYRHDALTHEVSALLDGARGPSAVLGALHEHYPQYAFTQEWVDELVGDLQRGGFLEESFKMNEIQRARAREARKKLSPGSLKNLLNVQFGIIDPTSMFRVVYPVARVLFTRPFVIVSVIAFVIACGLLWDRREALVGGLSTIFTLENSNLLGLAFLWIILFLIVVAHEFGHGLCCVHFGGQPRRLGFMLFYLMPGMFCDVSDIYFFERRWHRAAVALAGGYVEILCFTAATFLWVATPPDLLIHAIAYRVMLFSGATGLVFNYNPLIKLDGYYVLMSWLDMPDLRERAFQAMGDWFKGKVLRLPVSPERITRRERRAFWIYGVLAWTYSIGYTWIMLLFVRSILVSNFREAGFLAFAALFLFFTRKWWRKLWEGGRFLALERGGFVRRHIALAAGAAGLLVIALVVPLPHRVRVEAKLAPAVRSTVVAPFDGRVEEVLAGAGEPVRAGSVLAVVRAAPTSEAKRSDLGRALLTLESTRQEALARSRSGGLGGRGAAPAARARMAEAERAGREGWLVSPLTGTLLTDRPARLEGRAVEAGEALFEIGALDSFTVLLIATEREVGDIAPGAAVDLRLRSDPSRRLRCRVEGVDWAPQSGFVLAETTTELVDQEKPASRFIARSRIANPRGTYRPGMTGVARVDAAPQNALERVARLYARLVRADFWL